MANAPSKASTSPSTRGEFIVFVGPSGCGKSTLLRLVAGLEGIDGGTLMLDGRDITDQPSSKRDLAMVFQSYALYPHMSVYENMSFALKLAKVDKQVIDEKVQNAARILNLTEYLQRTPKELSAASASGPSAAPSCAHPRCFCLTSRCPTWTPRCAARPVWRSPSCTATWAPPTIYVTHDQVEATTLADKVVVLRDGQIEQGARRCSCTTGPPISLWRSSLAPRR